MDIQDKLIVKISNPYVSEFSVDLNDIDVINGLFCAFESDKIELMLVGKSYKVAIERHDSDEFIILTDGMYTVVSQGSTDFDKSYIPGKYCIEITSEQNLLSAFFTINPLPGITTTSLLLLKEALEKFQSGLSIDFFSDKTQESIKTESLSSTNYFSEMIYFINSFQSLIHAIRRISANPIEHISASYKIEPFPKKQDMRTQRWSQRQEHKGMQNLYLNKKTQINNNSKENIFLKFILRSIVRHICLLENDLKFNLDKKNKQINEMTTMKETKDNDMKEIELNVKVTEGYKSKMRNIIYHISNEIQQSNEQVQSNVHYLSDLNKMKYELENLLYFGWMSNIVYEDCPVITLSFLSNHDYKTLYDFYLTFVKKNKINFHNEEKLPGYMSKQTYKLFELYHLILVFYALKNKGYKFCESKDSFQSLFSSLDSSDFTFSNDKFNIVIRYDRTCQDELMEDHGFIAQAQHNKPDIIILIKDTNDIALHYIILEIKCRRLSNIYVKKGNTSVMETAKEYANNIKYVEKNKIKELKKSVIIVYPDHEDRVIEERYNTYSFVSSEITLSYEENHMYKNMMKLLENY